jgi:hypothetical protein
MPKVNMDYKNTIMYKIVCDDLEIKDCYVGHTTNFIKRKCQHKKTCESDASNRHNLKVYKTIRDNGGWENWSMIEIEKYPCNDKHEAEKRERYWIETLKSSLNCYIPTRTQSERYQVNNLYIKAKVKEYRDKNKEAVKQRHKKYVELNQDSVKQYAKEYRAKHKEKASEYKKEYRTKNIDTIKAKEKAFREANKEKINEKCICECGITVMKRYMKKHLTTKKHQKYLSEKEEDDDEDDEDDEDDDDDDE